MTHKYSKKKNWQLLPSRKENEEELRGDFQEQRSRNQPGQNGVANYIKSILQNVQWGLAKTYTNNQTANLKLKEGITPAGEGDKGKREYQNLLLQKAKWGFYGSFLAGALGVTMNCIGFGMICLGKTDLGVPTTSGGFSLEVSALFMQRISKDANDRLDDYYSNTRDKDDDTEAG